MTRYRYFLLSSVLQFPYSFNVQQYRFFFAPPQALGFAPTLPLHRKSYRRPWQDLTDFRLIRQKNALLDNELLLLAHYSCLDMPLDDSLEIAVMCSEIAELA